jgi:hypothetical protein
MTEKQASFFYQVENGRIKSLGDEFKLAFTPDLPEVRNTENKL